MSEQRGSRRSALSALRTAARYRSGLLAGAAVLVTGVLALGIGLRPGPGARPSGATARVGQLSISAAYVVEPATPDVAAGYLTVTNNGAGPDVLTSVSSDASATVSFHAVQVSGSVGRMVGVTSFEIPAHSQLALVPGQDHLMLEGTRRTLAAGDIVHLELTFTQAGSVSFEAPVVSQADASRLTTSGASSSGGR